MDPVQGVERFLEVRAQFPNSFAIWHARIATHGSKCVENCHPFPIGNDPLSYFAHNGVLPMYEVKDDDRSDSRIFAEETIRDLGGVQVLDSPRVFELLQKWSTYNKWAVLTLNPKAEFNLYIMNEEKGDWVNGVWWSNKNHIPAKVYEPYKSPSWYQARTYDTLLKEHVLKEPWEEHYKAGLIYDSQVKAYKPSDYETPIIVVGTPKPKTIRNWDDMSESDWRDWQMGRGDFAGTGHMTTDSIDWGKEEDPFLDDDMNKVPVWELCPTCEQESDLEEDEDYCMLCGSCFTCSAQYSTCMCYQGTSSWATSANTDELRVKRIARAKKAMEKALEEAETLPTAEELKAIKDLQVTVTSKPYTEDELIFQAANGSEFAERKLIELYPKLKGNAIELL